MLDSRDLVYFTDSCALHSFESSYARWAFGVYAHPAMIHQHVAAMVLGL